MTALTSDASRKSRNSQLTHASDQLVANLTVFPVLADMKLAWMSHRTQESAVLTGYNFILNDVYRAAKRRDTSGKVLESPGHQCVCQPGVSTKLWSRVLSGGSLFGHDQSIHWLYDCLLSSTPSLPGGAWLISLHSTPQPNSMVGLSEAADLYLDPSFLLYMLVHIYNTHAYILYGELVHVCNTSRFLFSSLFPSLPWHLSIFWFPSFLKEDILICPEGSWIIEKLQLLGKFQVFKVSFPGTIDQDQSNSFLSNRCDLPCLQSNVLFVDIVNVPVPF